MSLMRAEIAEQPAACERTLAPRARPRRRWRPTSGARGCDVVVLVARGTSDHAAIYARYLLEARRGLIAAWPRPSLYTAYGAPATSRGRS